MNRHTSAPVSTDFNTIVYKGSAPLSHFPGDYVAMELGTVASTHNKLYLLYKLFIIHHLPKATHEGD